MPLRTEYIAPGHWIIEDYAALRSPDGDGWQIWDADGEPVASVGDFSEAQRWVETQLFVRQELQS